MKKHSFYSIIMKNHKPYRVLHNGYSDGTYYYYKNNFNSGAVWYAIAPNVGLSVAEGHTRKAAQQAATARGGLIAQKLAENGEKLAAQFINTPIYTETEAV